MEYAFLSAFQERILTANANATATANDNDNNNAAGDASLFNAAWDELLRKLNEVDTPIQAADNFIPLISLDNPLAIAVSTFFLPSIITSETASIDIEALLRSILGFLSPENHALTPVQVSCMVVGLCGSLPHLKSISSMASMSSMASFLGDLRVAIVTLLNGHAGVALRAARFLHLLCLLEGNDSATTTANIESLVNVIFMRKSESCMTMGILSLLGHLASEMPVMLSRIIPAMVDLYDDADANSNANGIGISVMVERCLERQLGTLLDNPSAEKFHPLIMEVVKRGKSSTKRKTASANAGANATAPIPPLDEEDEESSILERVGSKRAKVDTPLNVTQYPLRVAVEVVMHFLKQLGSGEQIARSLEAWRPSATAAIRDPRRRATSKSTGSATDADYSTAPSSPDQEDEPFELKPFNAATQGSTQSAERMLVWHYRHLLSFLLQDTASLTTTSTIVATATATTDNTNSTTSPSHSTKNKNKKKKEKIKAMVRLSAMVSSMGTTPLGDYLMDFCFEESLGGADGSGGGRMSLLLYWLRLLWFQSSSAYADAYGQALERLQLMIMEAPSATEWQTSLQKYLLDVPMVVGDQHVMLLDQLCRLKETRIGGLVVIERLIINRPALQSSLLPLLLSFCYYVDDASPASAAEEWAHIEDVEGLRKASVLIVADSLGVKPNLRKLIIAHVSSIAADNGNDHDGINHDDNDKDKSVVDLPLRMLFRYPMDMIQYCRVLLDVQDESRRLSVISLILILVATKDDFFKCLLGASFSHADLLKTIIDASIKRGWINVETQELISMILDKIIMEEWPLGIFELIAPLSLDIGKLGGGLAKFLTVNDPAVDGNRLMVATLFSRIAERITPVQLFCLLHRLEGQLSLKRALDASQICFSMTVVFKPDTLSQAINKLLDDETLSTLLLRSIIQSLSTYKALATPCLNSWLPRLVTREIWTVPRLWEGFLRCLKMMLPASCMIMLQLPVDQLELAFDAMPELKQPFLSYLSTQGSSTQAPYQHLTQP